MIATVGFAFPRLVWATYIGYSLIALLLTQVMVGSSNAPNWSDALYRGLGLMAVMTMWLWLLTPLELIYSGMPLALSWSVLVGWSVIRLVTRFANTRRVTAALLIGATAGYLHIGLAAGLVMSALGTIQPGSFQPLEMANVGDSSVLASARLFSAINYYAFVCLTTVDHLNSANHARIQNNVGTIDKSLRIDADIKWIAIGYGHTLAALGNFLSAVGLWNKAI